MIPVKIEYPVFCFSKEFMEMVTRGARCAGLTAARFDLGEGPGWNFRVAISGSIGDVIGFVLSINLRTAAAKPEGLRHDYLVWDGEKDVQEAIGWETIDMQAHLDLKAEFEKEDTE